MTPSQTSLATSTGNSGNFNALFRHCLLDRLGTATLLELLEDKICFIPWGCKVPGQQMALWLLFPTCLTWPFLPCMNSCFTHFSAAQPEWLFFFCPFLCTQHKSLLSFDLACSFIHLCMPSAMSNSCQIYFPFSREILLKLNFIFSAVLNRWSLHFLDPHPGSAQWVWI